jgi:ribonuclease BN (tRNA processing enzyme)
LFLTHLHSDHTVGIPDLWLTGWARGRKVPLQVWGPAGTKEMMLHLKEAFQYSDPPGRRRTACACRRHSVHGHRARRRV